MLTLYSDGTPFTDAFMTEARIVNELALEAVLADQAGADSDSEVLSASPVGLDSAFTHQATGMISVQVGLRHE